MTNSLHKVGEVSPGFVLSLVRQKYIAISHNEGDHYPDSASQNIADDQSQEEGAQLPIGAVTTPVHNGHFDQLGLDTAQ